MSHKQNDIWLENMYEQHEEEEARLAELQSQVNNSTTSYLEHQRDNYWEMVCEQLDKEHRKFLQTLIMIDRELLVREIRSGIEARKSA